MKEIIAFHGWGGDSNTWTEWANYFQGNGWAWKSFEKGYGKLQPISPSWSTLNKSKLIHRRVLIGYSLGPHLISKDLFEKATDIILLCSFSRFIGNGRQGRKVKSALKGMSECFGTKREKNMLFSFLKNASQPNSIKDFPTSPISKSLSETGRDKLKADLELIGSTNGLPQGFPTKANVLVIQAQQDAIVTPIAQETLIEDLKTHLVKPPTQWTFDHTGHMLKVPNLLELVRDWLE